MYLPRCSTLFLLVLIPLRLLLLLLATSALVCVLVPPSASLAGRVSDYPHGWWDHVDEVGAARLHQGGRKIWLGCSGAPPLCHEKVCYPLRRLSPLDAARDKLDDGE